MYSLYEKQSDTPAKDAEETKINSDIFADKTPVDPALVHETPMGGTLAAIEPANEPVASEVPMYETPDQEIPMGGTVAAVGPMTSEPPSEVVPLYQSPVEHAPMGWSADTVRPVDDQLRSEAIPLYGTTEQHTPLGATDAVVHPMNSEMVADAIPMYETPVKEISLIETEVVAAPVSDTVPYKAPVSAITPTSTPLLSSVESEHFRIHWNEIQGKFVDDPRTAVLQADVLVDEVIAEVAKTFAEERSTLEGKWKQNADVSTEDLRKALQLYRSFFNRLVV